MESAPQPPPPTSARYEVEILDADGHPVGDEQPGRPRTLVSWAIIALNLGVYLAYNVAAGHPPIELAFSPADGHALPQIVTHMFAHGSGMHLLGNMLVVFFLGAALEPLYGGVRYGTIYLASGIIAALVEASMNPFAGLLGASGATSALIVMFARHYPRAKLYIYFVVPVSAWLLAVLWLAFNLFAPFMLASVPVAFTAHVAGMAAGLALSLFLLPPVRRRRGSRG